MNNEVDVNKIIEPMKKEVKRPVMKALSMILIPLSICLILIISCIYLSYYMKIFKEATLTEEDWKKYEVNEDNALYGDRAGCGSYEEYKEKVWEEQGYAEIPFIPIILITIGIGAFGIIARNSYKKGQEEG